MRKDGIAAGAVGIRAELAAYLASVRALGAGLLTGCVVLAVLGSAVEGLGIVLLVPLVATIFGDGGAIPERIARAFAWMGVEGRTERLGSILVLLVVLALVRALILWRREVGLARLGVALVDAWRARMVAALCRASWSTLSAMRRSRIEFAITEEVGRLSIGSDRLLRGGSALLQLAVQLALAFWLDPRLSLVAVVLIVSGLPLLRPILRAAHDYGAHLSRAGAGRHATFSDFVAGMKLAKAYDAEERYARDFNDRSAALRARSVAYVDARARGANAFQVAALIAAIALLLAGIHLVHTPAALLSAMLVLLSRLPAPLLSLTQGLQSLVIMLPAVGELLTIERTLLDGAGAAVAGPAESAYPAGPASVVLDAVEYRHDPRSAPVLDRVAATIAAGEFVALVGASGAGKTTLADIVTGLLAPQAGTLLIDDIAVADDAARAAWRRQTGYVPQDPFLFDDSVRANLAWAAPDADDAALWRALEAAEAAAFVRALPDGIETRVGDRGALLSGGERQRICLARALVRGPRILILDEATSALDRPTELRLFETLRRLRGSVTILMITHRLPDTDPPDRILRLEGGGIAVP
ncbi:ATP-binding cassette domain-containing protein [Sphingomonas immobilis]|uniref:ATP-binding cassette domain-containing protein n=1 Tax=Sphingomonas immobilis TaxID=3063997 RepID=A0ABT8ZZZ6_9SPHN|nr:ATP-binding cassette domain-containing protein [Sphingomonas sp. CA1-15]MDO7843151.1 ATP-binding cassette domain-containing protein [Sphingomonas sp. CA1-15]